MYYNILSELKNATRAKKDKVIFPFSKMDFAVLKTLVEAAILRARKRKPSAAKMSSP